MAIIILVLSVSVIAIGIGVNKAEINYENVLKNGYAEQTIVITTDSPYTLTGTYIPEGDLAKWLRFEPKNKIFNFSRDKPYTLKLIVEPSEDAKNDFYQGGLRIQTGDIKGEENAQYGIATKAAFLIKMGLGITGDEMVKCTAGNLLIDDTEEENLNNFYVTIHNEGNVRISPQVNIKIYDKYRTKDVKDVVFKVDEDILPTTTIRSFKQFLTNLPQGQYWAEVEIPMCLYKTTTTFDILNQGGIADKGELIRIDANGWVNTGDIVPINAVFKNLGTRAVSAKFKGKITREDNNKIYKVIDTDLYTVQPDEVTKIESFFNPLEYGKYIVSGVVLYNNKLTYEKSTIINVHGKDKIIKKSISLTPILIIIIIIIILILIIIKREKEDKKKNGKNRNYGNKRARIIKRKPKDFGF